MAGLSGGVPPCSGSKRGVSGTEGVSSSGGTGVDGAATVGRRSDRLPQLQNGYRCRNHNGLCAPKRDSSRCSGGMKRNATRICGSQRR